MVENDDQHKSQICRLIIELLRHHNGTKFNKNFHKKSHSRSMKCLPKANNNREAVVVYAIHIVKRPSKRIALVE